MAEETEQPGQPITPPVTEPVPAPATPTVPDDYEELKAFRAQVEQTIAPYWEDIRPIVEDEAQRTFWKQARQNYEAAQKTVEPDIPDELKPVVDRFEKRLSPLVDYLEAERKSKEDAQKAQLETAQKANLEYAQRLAAERPDLAEDNYAGIEMLAAYASKRGYSLEDAWKRIGNSFSAPVKREAPPRSLRGSATAPGVPAESETPKGSSRTDILNRLKTNIRAQKGA